jgi:UDP-N-acetylglucosamine--N-acetylmuramyl-(pentapeptide) pyrophosphoryl-undecaprenol N-acetylglucosamine transferase
MTLAELSVRGKAAILIPSPHVAEDHQYKNARLLADAGAAVVYRESELDSGILKNAAKDLLENDNKRKRIEDGIRNFAAPDSADRIASEVIRLAEE